MGLFSKKTDVPVDEKSTNVESSPEASARPSIAADAIANADDAPVTWLAISLGAISSIGGFIFGYESGQISGTLKICA